MTPAWQHLCRANPAEFRRRILIDTGFGLEPYGVVYDDWQERDFLALDPGWKRVAFGTTDESAFMRAYLERPRGHDKTTGIAMMAAWVLFASAFHLEGVAAAADSDQAGLVRNAIERLLYNNPWLAEYLTVQQNKVINKHTKSTLKVVATDGKGNYGRRDNFIILDELTHWDLPKHQDNYTALVSEYMKLPNLMSVIISNAGYQGHWTWTVRETAREEPDWYFSRLNGPQASWMTEAQLDEQRRALAFKGSEYKRLVENVWVPGVGDALSAEDIAAAFRGVKPRGPQRHHIYVGGIDLGSSHDHSAVVILGAEPGSGVVELVECLSWAPEDLGDGKQRVDNVAVRETVKALHQKWGVGVWRYDPHEMRTTYLDLMRLGLPMQEQPFQGKHLNNMAGWLLDVFNARAISLYPQEDLKRDLMRLSIVRKSFGHKLEGTRDEYGHCDRATALTIALPVIAEVAGLGMEDPLDADGLGGQLPGMEAYA